MGVADQIPTFTYFVSRLAQDHPNLAYLSIVEPGLSAGEDKAIEEGEVRFSSSCYRMVPEADLYMQTNDFIRNLWLPRTLISAGRYTRESAIQKAEETGELIAFGRRFLSNVCFTLYSGRASPQLTFCCIARPSV